MGEVAGRRITVESVPTQLKESAQSLLSTLCAPGRALRETRVNKQTDRQKPCPLAILC